jgi:flagellar motor switch protein FliM
MIDKLLANMFEPKRSSKENLANYIGARVTDAEEAWLRAEMKKRKLSMSDLIRLALGQFKGKA